MTTAEILKQIHVIYEGDDDAPTAGDEDYQIRLTLINLAIKEWETTPHVKWRCLVTWLHDTSDETYSLDTENNCINLPADFSQTFDGVIYLGDQAITEINPEEYLAVSDTETPHFYITGNQADGYKARFVNALVSEGENVDLCYIKRAKEMIEGTDIPELDDPTYIIHRVVAELCGQDSDPRTSRELGISQSLLDNMVGKNANQAVHTVDTYI